MTNEMAEKHSSYTCCSCGSRFPLVDIIKVADILVLITAVKYPSKLATIVNKGLDDSNAIVPSRAVFSVQ